MDTKALRQKILDLAIRGMLVPQDPNDEPASVLLERIREEKKQMVKEGKLKVKDIKNDTIIFKGDDNLHYEKFQDGTVKCIEDEIPFEVPEGWEWTRTKNITCKIGAGSTPTGGASVYSGTGIKFIRSQNVYEDGLVLDDIVYISEEINNRMTGSIVLPKDILLNITGGSIGRSSLVPDDFDIGNVNQHVLIVRMVNPDIRQFVHNVIISPYVQNLIIKRQVGSGRGGLSAASFSEFLLPIPSQPEQNRIIGKLSETLSLISVVTDSKEEVATIIDATKNKVLDLAIRGKLVPQDSNDEPASVLLERIRSEKEKLIKQGKLKRDRKESIIYRGDDNSYYELIDHTPKCIDDEIPFEVPDGWSWARGKHIFIPMENRKPTGDTFDYIDIDSIDNKNNVVTEPKHLLSSDAPSRASRAVFNGSVVFSTVRPYLKNIAYIDERLENCIASTGFYICTSNGALYPQYMFLLMISHYVVNGLNQYMKGDNSPSINKDNIDNWLFPIPPYKEQIRIQEKVSSYLDNVLKIETNLL